jgi:predicted phage tail protein
MVANVTAFTSGRDLASVSENVELLTGQRGNKLDKAVTYRDLESLGVATLSRIGSSYSAKANPVLTTTASVVDTPTKPKNVQANGAFNTILIDWDEPDYRGHSYAEVWRSETDNLSIAVKVGTTSARMYSDPIGGDAKVYYWVRFVNSKDDPGPYNSSSGTYAETAVDVQQLLDSLQGQIESLNRYGNPGAGLRTSLHLLLSLPNRLPTHASVSEGKKYKPCCMPMHWHTY